MKQVLKVFCMKVYLIRKSMQWLYVNTPEWKHFKECMCRLQNIATCKCDYQKSMTTGQTADARQSYPYMLLRFTGDTKRKRFKQSCSVSLLSEILTRKHCQSKSTIEIIIFCKIITCVTKSKRHDQYSL